MEELGMSKIVGIEDNCTQDELFPVEWNLENAVIIIVVTVVMNTNTRTMPRKCIQTLLMKLNVA